MEDHKKVYFKKAFNGCGTWSVNNDNGLYIQKKKNVVSY